MSGFDNEILNCENVDFTGDSPVEGQIDTDGQLLIGSSSSPYIRAGLLTSTDGSITFTTGSGTIDLASVGGGGSGDDAIARYDSTTGKLIQNSVVTIDDVGVATGFTQLDVDNLTLDGNTVSSTDVNGDVIVSPNGTGGAVVTTDLTVGNTSQDISFTINGASITATISAEGKNATDLGGIISHRHSSTAGFGGHLVGLRSRGTHSSPTVVADNDVLSLIASAGFDGTDYALAGQITVEVDGTPGSNDMPGRMIFSTSADSAQTPIEALRIDSSQVITLANALPETSGGTNQTTYTTGDILYSSAANTLSKLAVGSNTEVLTLAAGIPSWAAPAVVETDDYTYSFLLGGM